ncbi:hypothetical protein ES332_A06G157000v1 [Gossypium tomentosum]|uniref:Large ribosomal subunit protein eL20 domain-containing protein n=1 Tax=Gossypium tomentosum TaxID=34277 RepID=A0A5D2Q4B4_GOSTO|nr:hypothetical protein ES332_A06G157000v1 [Gossypium tomentosum]
MLSNKVKRAHPLQVWAASFAIAILKQQGLGSWLSNSWFSNKISEKNPTKFKNYGIRLRYQSHTGYLNMYMEYRDTILNGVVEQKYTEMASRHRVWFLCIQIIKTTTIPAKLCKRDSTKQLHNSKIKFPLVFNKVRPPTRKLKTTYKASKSNLFKLSHCNERRVNVVYSSKIFGSEHLSIC